MGISKTEIFTISQNQMANYFRVLGHPARVKIIEFLITQKECVCGDIVSEIGLAQATISQHLKELKSIGLIKGTITGTKTNYCVDQEAWATAKKMMNSFFEQSITCTEDNCC